MSALPELPTLPTDAMAQVRQWLAQARHVAVLSGAGMSAESGVPTFRDVQSGLWANFKAEELATEVAFRTNPERVWDWYAQRRADLSAVSPNAGHRALAAFGQRRPGCLSIITQNVDGLHQRAGADLAPGADGGCEVLALHGNITQCRWLDAPCPACAPLPLPGMGADGPVDAQGRPQDWPGLQRGHPPTCRSCGNRVRPDVVWFGEMLPATELAAAERAAAQCELMLVVGTAGVVYPAAGLAHQARRSGARVVVLNIEATGLDAIADAVLRGTAATLLPALLPS